MSKVHASLNCFVMFIPTQIAVASHYYGLI